ncbi:MAG TPA: tetratricopeptide repeat protein [Rhodocyclaceae bacterium]|nr:tetratricopeptide repeat protein [Rhodocyclaceae bacterium]
MSLINDMLRDLEARRAGELAKPDLQREIRPLPEVRRSFLPTLVAILAGLLATIAAAAAVWWQADRWIEGRAEVESSAVPAAQPSTPASAPVPVEISADTVTEVLRLSEELSSQPVEEAPPETSPVPKPKAPLASRPANEPAAAVTTRKEPAPAKSAPVQDAAASEGNIEKTVVLGTPRERADAEYRRAQTLAAAGGAASALVDALQAALKQDKTYNPPRQLLLKVYLESRRIDEAIALLQEGVEQQPGQIGWTMSLARLQVERGDVAAGERTLARFAAYGGGNAEYLGFHGHLLNRLGQYREAAERYTAASRIAPADGRWWFGLGQALEGSGRGDDARGAFRRALEAGNLTADLMVMAEQKAR